MPAHRRWIPGRILDNLARLGRNYSVGVPVNYTSTSLPSWGLFGGKGLKDEQRGRLPVGYHPPRSMIHPIPPSSRSRGVHLDPHRNPKRGYSAPSGGCIHTSRFDRGGGRKRNRPFAKVRRCCPDLQMNKNVSRRSPPATLFVLLT